MPPHAVGPPREDRAKGPGRCDMATSLWRNRDRPEESCTHKTSATKTSNSLYSQGLSLKTPTSKHTGSHFICGSELIQTLQDGSWRRGPSMQRAPSKAFAVQAGHRLQSIWCFLLHKRTDKSPQPADLERSHLKSQKRSLRLSSDTQWSATRN